MLAAKILGHSGDIGRFPSADRLASYAGTAPIEASSGTPSSCAAATPLVVCRGFGWVVEGGAASADFGDDLPQP